MLPSIAVFRSSFTAGLMHSVLPVVLIAIVRNRWPKLSQRLFYHGIILLLVHTWSAQQLDKAVFRRLCNRFRPRFSRRAGVWPKLNPGFENAQNKAEEK